jgi:hypothetical protein
VVTVGQGGNTYTYPTFVVLSWTMDKGLISRRKISVESRFVLLLAEKTTFSKRHKQQTQTKTKTPLPKTTGSLAL